MATNTRKYMIADLAKEFGVDRSRISQLVNGYTRSDGVSVESVLEPDTDFIRDWQTIETATGKKRMQAVVLITESGRAKLKDALANSRVGRPKKTPTEPKKGRTK